MHQTSTYIEISGKMLNDQFCLGVPMTFDLFDIAIRRLKQIESKMYPEGTTIRWRHWLESNFAVTSFHWDYICADTLVSLQTLQFVVPFRSIDN